MQHYVDFVAAGGDQPSPWENLKNQIFLGSEDFVTTLQLALNAGPSLREIPAVQRRPSPKPLAQIAGEYETDRAIFHAYATGGYSMQEIGDYFGLHYSRVSRILKQQGLINGKS
ncbi:MAG: hypothetical protein L0220_03485 [Acidobacteria bacterium]|nr:hypothetical protein [Acidobacteriota bacterium]